MTPWTCTRRAPTPGTAINELSAAVAGRGRRRHHQRDTEARGPRAGRATSTSSSPSAVKPDSIRCRAPECENWDTDEPSERGIDGLERMRLVRDDIAARVHRLHAMLTGA